MAIGADSLIKFFGTQDTLGSTTGTVSDGAFSSSGDLNTWTNDDDAPFATAVLEFSTSTSGDAGSFVKLYAQLLDIGDGGTEDTEAPDSNFPHIYLGSFPHNNPSTSAQTAQADIALPAAKASQVYQFYIENETGQTISAGWDLHITPYTYGPHA